MITKATKKKFYNKYHKDNKNKNYFKIIGENNFTYYLILRKLNKLMEQYPKDKKLNILDLGCGVGSIDFYLAEKGHFVTGIDVSSDAIKICNNLKDQIQNKNIEFIAADIFQYDVDKNFDMVICSEVIEHVPKDRKLLKQIFTLLKPKGFLFLSTPSINAPLYQLGLLDDFDKKVGHLRRYSDSYLKKIVRDSGFRIVDISKVESVVRNFLFTIPPYGFLIKFIRGYLTPIFHYVDTFLVDFFGESNLILIAQKRERCEKCGKFK